MWPFRKKKPQPPAYPESLVPLADEARAQLDRLREQMAQQQIAEFEDHCDHARKIRIDWTPVINPYGQILALAWKNDPETAQLLLEEPAEGRA